MTHPTPQKFNVVEYLEDVKQVLCSKGEYEAASKVREVLVGMLPPAPTPPAASPQGEGVKYLVYSREHNAWWGPNGRGYFTDINSAGRYTYEAAWKCCEPPCRRGLDAGEGVPKFMMLAPESHAAGRASIPRITALESARKERKE